jgi:hypothetical protein
VPDSNETESERLDRNFGDLLQELRVAQTGVQILFAFLLTLAFSARFEAIDTFEKTCYLVALLSSAAAAALIIGPVAYHRALFRRGQKDTVVRVAHRMASAGLFFLFLAMVGAVLLVTDFVLDRGAAILASSLTAAWFVLLWAVLPWRERRRGDAGNGAGGNGSQ